MAGSCPVRRLRRVLVLAGLGSASFVSSPAAANDLVRPVDPQSGRPLLTDGACLFAILDELDSELFPLRGFRARPLDELPNANQRLFSLVCGGTVSISGSLDGSSCAWTAFGSPSAPAGAPQTGSDTILAELVSATLAGEVSSAIAGPRGLLAILQTDQKGSAELPVPLRPANRDLRDGVATSLGPIFDRDGIPYNADSPDDLLSLDSVLSAEQGALLGCGPFYGTRCDSSQVDGSTGFAEGGIDFRRAELGALVLAAPVTFGGRLAWSTTRLGATQPGTIGFTDAACMRWAPGDRLADDLGRVRLPGCRGIAAVVTENLGNLPAGAPIEFLFERGYAPGVDGCMLGVSNPGNPASRGVAIAGHPVLATRLRARDDPAFDARDPVGSAEDITATLNATCGGLESAAQAASSTRIGTAGYAEPSEPRSFAQTAWHPLAGCRSSAQAHDLNDAVRRCEFTSRDYEAEFLAGDAQIFRSEMAAASWNLLALLVLSSCDAARGGDDLHDSDCFDPRVPGIDANGDPIGGAAWAPDRCSLAAPQLCRNVRPLLDATMDEDGDGVPDLLEGGEACDAGAATPEVLWPPNRRWVAVELGQDPSLRDAAVEITAVTQDEPLGRKGKRRIADARIDGERVWLRADRKGSGNGRVYRVTYTATRPIANGCGASASCTSSVEVCVPHGRKKRCRDDGQRWDATAR